MYTYLLGGVLLEFSEEKGNEMNSKHVDVKVARSLYDKIHRLSIN